LRFDTSEKRAEVEGIFGGNFEVFCIRFIIRHSCVFTVYFQEHSAEKGHNNTTRITIGCATSRRGCPAHATSTTHLQGFTPLYTLAAAGTGGGKKDTEVWYQRKEEKM
jgi:hypothetical protein